MKISFYGACRQITGSCYLLETEKLKILIDCGLYQERDFLSRNWKPFPFKAESVDYLILTHVHLDHSGLIPKLCNEGFRGKIVMTEASNDLLPIVLLDSARIQEEDASYKKRRHKRENRKGPYPEVPLYTEDDVKRCFLQFQSVPCGEEIMLSKDIKIRFHDAGHILGSAMLEFIINSGGSEKILVFSGDIGQWNKPLMKDPSVFDRADYVVMESLYADRIHEDPQSIGGLLQRFITETVKAGGNVIIPTFAVERAQELLYYLHRLVWADKIPYMMMFLDSPMAVDVTDAFLNHERCLDKETLNILKEGKRPFQFPGLKLIRSVAESKAINNIRGSCVIMAGSGMCTGGRVKHHLVQNISRPESTIIFVGYQAYGTLGRQILEGKESVRILGKSFKVRNRIEEIHGFSAHADKNGLFKWINHLSQRPKTVFLTHGEYESAMKLSGRIAQTRGWATKIPEYMESFKLDR